jgi:hypothetical protein
VQVFTGCLFQVRLGGGVYMVGGGQVAFAGGVYLVEGKAGWTGMSTLREAGRSGWLYIVFIPCGRQSRFCCSVYPWWEAGQ